MAVALRNQRVILIDADRQQSSAKWGSRRQMSGIDPEINFASLLADKSVTEFIDAIRNLGASKKFDVCIIDVGGHDSRELRAAVSVADVLLAPCLPSQVDVEALGEFDDLLDEVAAFNSNLKVVTVINKASTGLFAHEIALASDAIAELNNLDRPIGVVADRPNYRKAWLDGQGVFDLEPTEATKKPKMKLV